MVQTSCDGENLTYWSLSKRAIDSACTHCARPRSSRARAIVHRAMKHTASRVNSGRNGSQVPGPGETFFELYVVSALRRTGVRGVRPGWRSPAKAGHHGL